MFASEEIELLDGIADVPFENRVADLGKWPIKAGTPTILQMNLGYRCNQSCAHCHLDAGPHRMEMMSDEVIDSCLDFARRMGIANFDVTGGAPELHPKFRYLIEEIRKEGWSVTDRCNLTILSEPGQEHLAEFLASNEVNIVSSLPHFRCATTDSLRGDGVFARSISGLRKLNDLGYGEPDSGLELTLVHNPSGAYLPGDQKSLEKDFRGHLQEEYDVRFTNLIAITNMPLGRFLDFLERSGNLAGYMKRLEENFNPATLENVMCRHTISVGYDGILFDCDFNQCLGITIGNGTPRNIIELELPGLDGRDIRCSCHCYGCTAGKGSSCGGTVA